MALSYNLGYQESISVHPTRRRQTRLDFPQHLRMTHIYSHHSYFCLTFFSGFLPPLHFTSFITSFFALGIHNSCSLSISPLFILLLLLLFRFSTVTLLYFTLLLSLAIFGIVFSISQFSILLSSFLFLIFFNHFSPFSS